MMVWNYGYKLNHYDLMINSVTCFMAGLFPRTLLTPINAPVCFVHVYYTVVCIGRWVGSWWVWSR